MLTGNELDERTPGDVEFQRPLEDGRPEEGRPEDGRFEGGYSEDIGPVAEALEAGVVSGPGPVVRGTDAGEVDNDTEAVLDSEIPLPDDPGPVVNGIDGEELGLRLSDEEAFRDGPLDEAEDGLVCFEKDEDVGVCDDVEDCGYVIVVTPVVVKSVICDVDALVAITAV